MSKSLEALERLYIAGRLDLSYVMNGKHKEDYELIEKELKALKIIKEKINFYLPDDLTQEEYDLIVEVI